MNKEEVRKHIAIIHNMAKDYGLLDNEEISRTYQVIDYISNLEQQNKQLKDNWNKLKEWLNAFHKLSEFEQWEIVKKMRELEKGDSNE